MKTEKQFVFDVNLRWLEGQTGLLSSKKTSGTLQVGPPAEFGGEGILWSPEHYFLGAISGCFMTTFLVFARKLNFRISGFSCSAAGELEIVEGSYKFTKIHLYPKVHLYNEEDRGKALTAITKTQKYCLISHSVNAQITYHPEITLDKEKKEMFQ